MAKRTKTEAKRLYYSIGGKASTLWQDGGAYKMDIKDLIAIEKIVRKYLRKYFNEDY